LVGAQSNDMVAETLNLDPMVIAQFPKDRPDIVPI
jgi:hypothetical protein